MSDDILGISYAKPLAPLAGILGEVKRPGDFFAIGSMETPMPLLEVEGAGLVPFPVPPEHCRKLIDTAAERAPYGRGDQTLRDESVRKVWQIDAGKVRVGGKAWDSTLQALLARVEQGLGCPAGGVEAELYKLLIYDTGGFFKPHRDTEKSEGMFGTLVVSLPSAHSGGDLLIRHAGREVHAELCATDPSEIRYAAFYADCEHEVLPVESGNRVCLVFNLLHKDRTRAGPTHAPDYSAATEAAADFLREWAEHGNAPDKLVWLLEHQYTEAGLSLAALKNRDATIVRVLRDAAKTAGCAFYLGILHIEESGSAEYTGGFYGYGRRGRVRYWEDDDEDDEDQDDNEDFEIGEIYDDDRYIDQWRDAEDRPVEFGHIPLEDDEVLPIGALENEKPDKLHFSEATGNEGASFERTYLRAAVVLWPENRTDLVCAAAGLDAAIERLGQRVADAKHGDVDAATAIETLAGTIKDRWHEDSEVPRLATTLFGHLVQHGDPGLIARFWSPTLIDAYDGAQNAVLAEAVEILGAQAKDLLRSLIDARHDRFPGACIDLWIRLSKTCSSTKLLESVTAPALSGLIECLRQPAPKPDCGYPYYWRSAQSTVELTPNLVAEFLAAIAKNSTTAKQIIPAAEALAPAYKRFTTDEHLLRALEFSGRKATPIPDAARDTLWRHCAEDLLARAEFPPEIPKDWAQKVSLGSRDRLLKELEKFARDPKQSVHRFPVRKDLRQTLHRAIEQHRLDMTHVTERRGSPYTLVCTKTHTSSLKKFKQHKADKALIERLLSLPDTGRQPASIVERLRRAITRATPTSKDLPSR